MDIKVLNVLVSIIVAYLLILLIDNIDELYQPRLEIATNENGKALVLWYNHITDESITREYKVLIKL